MLGFGDADVGHAVEDPLQADASLRPGERRPRTRVDAVAERDVLPGVRAVDLELVRALEAAGSRFAAPLSIITVVPAGTSTPPSVVVRRAMRKSLFTGLSMRRTSSTKLGMRSRSSRRRCWMSGFSAISWSALERRRAVVSWPAAKRKVAIRTTSRTSGIDPSGKVALASPESTSSRGARLRSSTYEENQVSRNSNGFDDDHSSSVVAMSPGRCAPKRSRNSSWSACGTPSRSATTSMAKGCEYSLMNSHLPGGKELVELAVGELPHERFVLLEALRRDQPHQQRPMIGVRRGVEGHQVLVHRQLVAVLLDERADVVARGLDRKPGERTGHRVARRERRGVVVHGDGLVVARDRNHAVVRLADHRSRLAQVLEVRVRVGDEGLVREEVDAVEVAHDTAPVPRDARDGDADAAITPLAS